MERALDLAREAELAGEVPIGAVVVYQGVVVGEGRNATERMQVPTAHAEILAIEAASRSLGSRRLLDTTIYVTLEPCCMCAGAIVLARIPRLVFAALDPKAGACESLYTITNDKRLNHRCQVHSGLMADIASDMLKAFFKSRRLTS